MGHSKNVAAVTAALAGLPRAADMLVYRLMESAVLCCLHSAFANGDRVVARS